MDARERDQRKTALECASRLQHRGDIRRVLQDAELFLSWLKNDTTDVVVKIKERFSE